jgi:hypothetical protein
MKMFALSLLLATAIPTVAAVSVIAPLNNSNVATSVQYVATARSPGLRLVISVVSLSFSSWRLR